MKKYTIGLIGVLAVAMLFVFVQGVTAKGSFLDTIGVTAGQEFAEKLWNKLGGEVTTEMFGADAGPDKYNHQRFLSNFSVGGGQNYATTSTEATFTLTTDQFPTDREDGLITWNAGLDTTLTTMASTSEPFRSLKAGESYSVYLHSATTTAATTITFAAGTGIDLQEDEGGTVVVNGLELAKLTFLKKVDTDVFMLVEPYQVAD